VAGRGDAGDPEASARTGASRHPVEHARTGGVVLEPGSDGGGSAARRRDAGDPQASAGAVLEQAEEHGDEKER